MIPGNDDAIRAIQVYAQAVANACIEGATGGINTDEFVEVSEEVVAQAPAAEQPATEQPVVEQPATEQPAAK